MDMCSESVITSETEINILYARTTQGAVWQENPIERLLQWFFLTWYVSFFSNATIHAGLVVWSSQCFILWPSIYDCPVDLWTQSNNWVDLFCRVCRSEVSFCFGTHVIPHPKKVLDWLPWVLLLWSCLLSVLEISLQLILLHNQSISFHICCICGSWFFKRLTEVVKMHSL